MKKSFEPDPAKQAKDDSGKNVNNKTWNIQVERLK